jgi:hypothetical protein
MLGQVSSGLEVQLAKAAMPRKSDCFTRLANKQRLMSAMGGKRT